MFTRKKKVIYSLLTATLLSSSVASAADYNYTNQTYSNYNKGYDYNIGSSVDQNRVVNKYPTFKWPVTNRPNRPGINRPKPPVVDRPQVPNTKPDYGQGDKWKPNYPNRPNTPTPKPEEPTRPQEPASGISSIEMEVIRLVNIERQKEGLAPLTANSALSNVARKKSEDMAINNYFSHTSPTYGSPSNMMKSFGINASYSGENIAKGQLSAESVVRAWMNSSGHRANIMNPSFKNIGVGHYKSSNGTNLWTQMFTN